MKRNSERGVALVITLIMLALVTTMAVVFLAISRRDKASVTVSQDMANARLMTDAALARAQSEIASRFLSSSNFLDYDLIVSTNYYNPAGFRQGVASPFNVSYQYPNGTYLRPGTAGQQQYLDWLRNIANLQYDARVPVFVPVIQPNGATTNDFRFWLDLNRNGLFEATGFVPEETVRGFSTNYHVGDPQWIGVLEHPDQPHSESNQFIGRYCFIVLPTGKSLDINYIHNAAKRLRNDLSVDGFIRNEGVGSWEINLAGFFAALNTNIWVRNLAYNYNPNLTGPSTGTAFDDARAILRYRYQGNMGTLASARALFNLPAGNNAFTTSGIDYYSDGPFTTYIADPITQPWSGSYNPDGFYDVQEVFDPTKVSPVLVARLLTNNVARIPTAPAYDRYTYYRMLSQLGADSGPSISNKLYFADYLKHYTNRLNLNYVNVDGQNNVFPWNTYARLSADGETNLIAWSTNIYTRTAFFTNAADRLLRSSLDLITLTNGLRTQTNFMVGLTPVRNTFGITNIQIFHINAGQAVALPFYVTNNEYSATVHRLLQVAANIHDATTVQHFGTTNDYPSVFRPIFMRTATNLIICGYINQIGTENINNFMTPEQAMGLVPGLPGLTPNQRATNIMITGVPMIIGAKKGYPNFNKLVAQTVADISRRLEVRKLTPQSRPSETNQMYVIGISNRFGVEGWNSYARDFTRNLELHVAGQSIIALHHRLEGVSTEAPPFVTNIFFTNVVSMANWPGSATVGNQTTFVVPADTNTATLPSSIYLTRTGRFLPFRTNTFEKSFRVPQWSMLMTNRLQYYVVDKSIIPNRVIDFVNLDKLVTLVDLTRGLTGDTNAAGGGIFSDKNKPTTGRSGPTLTDGDMWKPQHSTTSLDSPSLGVLNQISVAKGTPFVGEGEWRSANGQVQDKNAAIQQFSLFLSGGLTNLSWQVPFTPSRKLYQRTSWEANDPLVHYTMEDLTDPQNQGPNATNLLVRPIDFNFPWQKDAMLKQINPRYRPWGGNPGKDPSNDQTAYAVTMKDSLIRRSDDWVFPTNSFPSLGWLGRVHRGTPWQTIYLKAGVDPRTQQLLDVRSWANWAGSFGTHPTNDWRLLDVFTVSPNQNASRGLLSVNQTNYAAWAAVLSGVSVVTNTSADGAIGPTRRPLFQQTYVHPTSVQMQKIVDGINRTHAQQNGRAFQTLGDILAVPELTVQSPFLNLTRKQMEQGLDDEAYERIPRQVLSLLRTDEPRVTVYAFGQSLRPADRSLVTAAGFFNLCTNYQITGEFATKTVLRLEDLPPQPVSKDVRAPVAERMRAVVESYNVLQPD